MKRQKRTILPNTTTLSFHFAKTKCTTHANVQIHFGQWGRTRCGMRWWTGDEHNIINNPHHGWNWSWCPASSSSNKNCKNNYGSYFIRPVVPSWVLLCVLPCVHEDNNWVLLLAVQKQGPSRAANLNLHTKGDFLYYKSAADHSHQIISIFMQISQWRWWWGATHPEATTWVRTHSQVSSLDLWFDQMLHEARGIKGCALTLSL